MKFHDELNPKLWENEDLKEDVKAKLHEIADAFIEFLEINEDAIEDIVITGSSASYNYTKYSDIDLHIVIDFEKVHEDCPIVEGYLLSKKSEFNSKHDIFIYGVPVELYAEAKEQGTVHNGLYSLKDEKWIDFPKKIEPTDNDAAVEAKYNEYVELAKDVHDADVAADLIEKIRTMRKSGLSEGGEFSTENLTFKKLRDEGIIGNLMEIKKQAIDKQLSLESYNEDNENKTQNSLQRKAGTNNEFWISSDTDKLLIEFTEQQLNSYVIVNSSFSQYAEGPTGANRSEQILIPYNWSVETVGWTKRTIPASYLKQNNLKSYSRKGKPTGGYGYIGAEKVTWKVMTLKQALETYKDWQTCWSKYITIQPLANCPDNSIKSNKYESINEEHDITILTDEDKEYLRNRLLKDYTPEGVEGQLNDIQRMLSDYIWIKWDGSIQKDRISSLEEVLSEYNRKRVLWYIARNNWGGGYTLGKDLGNFQIVAPNTNLPDVEGWIDPNPYKEGDRVQLLPIDFDNPIYGVITKMIDKENAEVKWDNGDIGNYNIDKLSKNIEDFPKFENKYLKTEYAITDYIKKYGFATQDDLYNNISATKDIIDGAVKDLLRQDKIKFEDGQYHNGINGWALPESISIKDLNESISKLF